MMVKFRNWLRNRSAVKAHVPQQDLRKTGTHTPPRLRQRTTSAEGSDYGVVNLDDRLAENVVDASAGKNVLIRNKYIREDTGTHETLKIIDDSLIDSGEETGLDPYNTGGFDRSKNWNIRFRK